MTRSMLDSRKQKSFPAITEPFRSIAYGFAFVLSRYMQILSVVYGFSTAYDSRHSDTWNAFVSVFRVHSGLGLESLSVLAWRASACSQPRVGETDICVRVRACRRRYE